MFPSLDDFSSYKLMKTTERIRNGAASQEGLKVAHPPPPPTLPPSVSFYPSTLLEPAISFLITSLETYSCVTAHRHGGKLAITTLFLSAPFLTLAGLTAALYSKPILRFLAFSPQREGVKEVTRRTLPQ